MSKDVPTAMADCLQALRLSTVRSQYEEVSRQATAGSWGYVEFLLELVQRECQQRQHTRIERLLKSSRLPLEKSWASLDLKRLPASNSRSPNRKRPILPILQLVRPSPSAGQCHRRPHALENRSGGVRVRLLVVAGCGRRVPRTRHREPTLPENRYLGTGTVASYDESRRIGFCRSIPWINASKRSVKDAKMNARNRWRISSQR